MSRLGRYLKSKGFNGDYFYPVLFLTAIVFFGLSFVSRSYDSKLRHEVSSVQRRLHRCEREAEAYALKAINSDDDWMDFPDMPDDIVLYCYQDDSLKFWAHQFPISNDDIVASPFSYRLQYTTDRNTFATPMAYLGVTEKYVNLGSAWYVVTTQLSQDYRKKVVTGVLIRTEYINGSIPDVVNPHLKLRKGYTTSSINNDDLAIVYGIEGQPLFSIVSSGPLAADRGSLPLRWISFALALLAVFPYHYSRRTWGSLWLAVLVLLAIRVLAHMMVATGVATGEIFSPMIYADTLFTNSLGSLLLNNVFISLVVYALFVMRYAIFRKIETSGRWQRIAVVAILSAVSVLLVLYTHSQLRSLTVNSNIVLETYRISELSFYSLLSYLTFAMLFLAILYMAHMVIMLVRKDTKVNLFSWRNILIYTVAVSVYSVLAVSVYGVQKEFERNRVNTAKLAMERDLTLELFLRNVEPAIASDPFISVFASVNSVELIKNRLLERYLYNDIVQKYNTTLTVCAPANLISLGPSAEPMGCFNFYEEMVRDYGTPLAPESNIFYINDYNGLTSYLGIFTYFDAETYQMSRLFMEIESKYPNDVATNPFDALSTHSDKSASLPRYCSYARYYNGRLVSHGGNYDYPVADDSSEATGYRMESSNGYTHFVNRLSDEDLVIISRPRRPVLPFVVSFSYLAIFYGIFLLLFSLWGRHTRLFNLPKHSLRRKIMFLATGSMILALVSMSIGSIVYVTRMNRETRSGQMNAMISSVQSELSDYCRYVMRYSSLSSPELLSALDEVSGVIKSDINLFDNEGRLVKSTKPEVYEQFIAGKRINCQAYKELYINKALRFNTVETLAGISFYSVYAPLFNNDGQMVGAVNVPYFNRSEEATGSSVATISAIVNIYLLLFLLAIIFGTLLSNSLSRPLAEIKKRIDGLVISGKNEHIRYKNSNDELGVLITSYNKMVDDLEESTRLLARSEREQAWTEMARQIAHDIKNPLTPMKLNIQQLMRMKSENRPGWQEKVDVVSQRLLEQIEILSNTASEFSFFAGSYGMPVGDVNIEETLREQVDLFNNRDDIRFEYVSTVGEDSIVEARHSQISRVFTNLITNAVQALDASLPEEGGRIRVSIAPVDAGGRNGFRIAVEDNGPGVGAENLDKLFVPNFTTKSSGTGLGLAICRRIVEQCQGTLEYSRSALGGACFTIFLPAKDQ